MVDLESLYPLFCSGDFTIKYASAILLSSLVCWASKDQFIAMESISLRPNTNTFYLCLLSEGGLHVLLASWLVLYHYRAFACSLHRLYKAASQLMVRRMMDWKMTRPPGTSFIISHILCLTLMCKTECAWSLSCECDVQTVSVTDSMWLDHPNPSNYTQILLEPSVRGSGDTWEADWPPLSAAWIVT